MGVIKEKKPDVDPKKASPIGALIATVLFVGGGILFFIVLLFYFYMTRV